ncbi:hypothetical protein B0H11DRAFT_2264467 [Mycena galericulata]|nr:hypothetical protein B0H11DRAFT_2264467 [Mycena galericulata]
MHRPRKGMCTGQVNSPRKMMCVCESHPACQYAPSTGPRKELMCTSLVNSASKMIQFGVQDDGLCATEVDMSYWAPSRIIFATATAFCRNYEHPKHRLPPSVGFWAPYVANSLCLCGMTTATGPDTYDANDGIPKHGEHVNMYGGSPVILRSVVLQALGHLFGMARYPVIATM